MIREHGQLLLIDVAFVSSAAFAWRHDRVDLGNMMLVPRCAPKPERSNRRGG